MSVYGASLVSDKIFEGLLPWQPIWSCDLNLLNKLLFLHPIKASYEDWFKFAQLFFKKKKCYLRSCMVSALDWC